MVHGSEAMLLLIGDLFMTTYNICIINTQSVDKRRGSPSRKDISACEGGIICLDPLGCVETSELQSNQKDAEVPNP